MSSFWPYNKIGTGNSAAGNRRRYSFLSWDDTWIVEAIQGLLYPYTQSDTWYQIGTASPDDAAAYFSFLYSTFGVDMATTGVIVPFAGGILPDGWLVCDGRSLARADYSNLFNAIGTVWGAVDIDHFNIPDLRGRTLVGQGTAETGTVYTLGGTGGEEQHQLTTAELASHAHSVDGTLPTLVVAPGEAPALAPNIIPGSTGSTGSDQPHNNMQPFAVVNYAIIT